GYATEDLRPVAFAAIDSQGLAVGTNHPARDLAAFLKLGHDKAFSFGFGGSSARIVAEYVFKVAAPTQGVAGRVQDGGPGPQCPARRACRYRGRAGGRAGAAGAARHRACARRHRRQARRRPARRADAERSGFPDLAIHGWIGVLAPAKTPTDICARLN